MNTLGLLYKTTCHVRGLFESNPSSCFAYHNLAHTEDVVRAANQIACHYTLSEEDYLSLLIAAWFHDTGYLYVGEELHVDKSSELAQAFLTEQAVPAHMIQNIAEAIMATKMPQQPTTLLGQILCDADLFHLGTSHFLEKDQQVKVETENRLKKEIPQDVWDRVGLQLLQRHQYHTIYCQRLLDKGKEANVDFLQKEKAEMAQTDAVVQEKEEKKNKKDKKDKKDKETKPKRGVETMFRITSNNNVRLSEMADNKANFLITISSIIVSLLVSVVFRKLDQQPHMLIPAILFLATSLITVVLAILVTMPRILEGKFTKEDIEQKKANLLFFGNYHSMPAHEYEWGMQTMMKDADYLYGSMVKDNYNMGVLLGKKYKKLRAAYAFFMVGMVVSVVAFTIAEIVANKSGAAHPTSMEHLFQLFM